MTKRTRKAGVTGKYGVVSLSHTALRGCGNGGLLLSLRPPAAVVQKGGQWEAKDARVRVKTALRCDSEEVDQEDGDHPARYLHVSRSPLCPSTGCQSRRKVLIPRPPRSRCTFCGKDSVKRTAVGIWHCKACKKTTAGGAWTVSTTAAATVRR